MEKEDPYRAAPQQAREAADDRARERHTEAKGKGQPDEDPERKCATDESQVAVGEEITRVPARVGHVLASEHPANMRVDEAAQLSTPTRSLLGVRAVRVPGLVGKVVMPAVG